MSKKFKEKLARRREHQRVVGPPPEEIVSRGVVAPDAVPIGPLGVSQVARDYPVVLVPAFVELEPVTKSTVYTLAQWRSIGMFRPESVLLFGTDGESTLESIMIGTEPQLLTSLPAAMFETPLKVLLDEYFDKAPGQAEFEKTPGFEFLVNMVRLREMKLATLGIGSIVSVVVTGKVDRIVLSGTWLK